MYFWLSLLKCRQIASDLGKLVIDSFTFLGIYVSFLRIECYLNMAIIKIAQVKKKELFVHSTNAFFKEVI